MIYSIVFIFKIEFCFCFRGILDLQWSPNDGNLLMSSGKDNKIICWNPNDLSVMAEIVYEIPCNHWCFDVKWCLGMKRISSIKHSDVFFSIKFS